MTLTMENLWIQLPELNAIQIKALKLFITHERQNELEAAALASHGCNEPYYDQRNADLLKELEKYGRN